MNDKKIKINEIKYEGQSDITLVDELVDDILDYRSETKIYRENTNLIVQFEEKSKIIENNETSQHHIIKTIKVGISELFETLNRVGYMDVMEKKLIKCEGDYEKDMLYSNRPFYQKGGSILIHPQVEWIDVDGKKIPTKKPPIYRATINTEIIEKRKKENHIIGELE